MLEEQFRQYLDKYILKLKVEINLLEQFKPEMWHKTTVDCKDISLEWFASKRDELEANGVCRQSAVLYYFELKDSRKSPEILKRIQELKSSTDNIHSLPRVNTTIEDDSSTVLYLGKSQKNFQERLKQHCGLRSHSTFALHLIAWAKSLAVELNLNYSIFPFAANMDLQVRIESMMHGSMKPLLGREGTMR
jgi:hypothetical protein